MRGLQCWFTVAWLMGAHRGFAQDQENAVGKWGGWSPKQRFDACYCKQVRACYSGDGQQLKNDQCPGSSESVSLCPSRHCKEWLPSPRPTPSKKVGVCQEGDVNCLGQLPCYDEPCPRWGEWSLWSDCPTKRRGKRYRTRQCAVTTQGRGVCNDFEEQPCCPHFKMELKPAQVKLKPGGHATTFKCRYESPLDEPVIIEMRTEPHTAGEVFYNTTEAINCGWRLISSMTLTWRGKFVICTVRNTRGDVIAKMASVILAGDPPTVIVGDSLVRVNEGSNTSLQCWVLQAAVVGWSRLDGSPLPPQAKTLPSGDLQVSNVRSADSGVYVCQADNEAGSSNQTVALEVSTKPVITLLPSDFLQKNINDSVTLECRVAAHPRPFVTWRHVIKTDGTKVDITQQNRTSGDAPSSKLVFPSLKKEDTGTYICMGGHQYIVSYAQLKLVVDDFNDVSEPQGKVSTTVAVVLPNKTSTRAASSARPTTTPASTTTTTASTTPSTTSPTTTESRTTSDDTVTSSTPEPTEEVTSTERPEDGNTQSNLVDTTILTFTADVCAPDHMRCFNRRCVPRGVYCDGADDCGDGSDEWNCDVTRRAYPCQTGYFLCQGHKLGFHCVPENFVCDGTKDCDDNSDEEGCNRL